MERSDDFTVTVNGADVFVHRARVSAVPLNWRWPGYQRPLDQTELASFSYWDTAGPAEVVVESARPVETVDIRPTARGIAPELEGNRVSFEMPGPGQLTVSNCVIWNEWGRALVQDFLYENIRFEIDAHTPKPVYQSDPRQVYPDDPNDTYCPSFIVLEIRANFYSEDEERGRIRNIRFRNIEVTGGRVPPSRFSGFDEGHPVENVKLENVRINGKPVTSLENGNIRTNEFVKNVRFSPE